MVQIFKYLIAINFLINKHTKLRSNLFEAIKPDFNQNFPEDNNWVFSSSENDEFGLGEDTLLKNYFF